MSLLPTNAAITDSEALRREIEALKGQLAGLSEASIAIAGNFDAEEALQEIVNRA